METKKQEPINQSIPSAVKKSPVASSTSSPTHEFSFAISLTNSEKATTTTITEPEIEKAARQSLAIDLSPADEIFFHGHLLPLHFLSHVHSSSPRSSTNSLDNFTLPLNTEDTYKPVNDCNACEDHNCDYDDDLIDCISYNNSDFNSFHEPKLDNITSLEERSHKNKHFSLFNLGKWRKLSDSNERSEQRQTQQHKKKVKFDVSQFMKKYVRMVKPLLLSKGEKIRVRRQSYSFSGVLSPRNKTQVRSRRGEFSAPASMRTSPTNSGLLQATAGVPSPVSDSTLEELQSAIQAAIAHCKNSIAAQENKTQDLSLSVN